MQVETENFGTIQWAQQSRPRTKMNLECSQYNSTKPQEIHRLKKGNGL